MNASNRIIQSKNNGGMEEKRKTAVGAFNLLVLANLMFQERNQH